MDMIFNGFNTVVDGLKSLLSAVLTLVEGIFAFVKWIPKMAEFSLTMINYIPSPFIMCATICFVIFVLKVVLGGDNGS